jgi:hypothetical protein
MLDVEYIEIIKTVRKAGNFKVNSLAKTHVLSEVYDIIKADAAAIEGTVAKKLDFYPSHSDCIEGSADIYINKAIVSYRWGSGFEIVEIVPTEV